MRKSIIILAAIALVVAGCRKNEEGSAAVAEKIQGVPMSLKVNFSKTSYEADGNVLKCKWAPGDSIAVVSFNTDGNFATVRSIDKFALRSGDGSDAGVFEGYYTGGDAPRILCFYPPVSPYQYDDLDMPLPDGYYGSLRVHGAKGSNSTRAISQLKPGSEYFHLNSTNYTYASAVGDLSPVQERSVMYGEATIDQTDPYHHTLNVSLLNLYSILKVTAVLPASLSGADVIKTLEVESTVYNAFGTSDDWRYAASPDMAIGGRSFMCGYYGTIGENEGKCSGINVPDDKTLVYYFVTSIKDQPANTAWTVTATDAASDTYTATVTFPSALQFEGGKMYRLTVNLQGTGSPAPPSATNLSPDNHTSNCYVIASDAPATYKFKNCKGENYNNLNGGAKSAAVLWESGADPTVAPSVGDIVASAEIYDDGYVYITTTGARGNAVVAVKDASDNILWSWHIWCTGAGFDPQADVASDGSRTWMKANLGAFSYATDVSQEWEARHEVMGLLYQYGRKDPFRGISELDLTPYTSAVTGAQPHLNQPVKTTNSMNWDYVTCDASKGTVAYATAHPMTFINPNPANNNEVVNDWVYTESTTMAASDRWGEVGRGNSLDNPCPYGWRVPSSSDLQSLISNYSAYNPSSWARWPNLGIVSNVNGMDLLLPACGSIRSNGQPLMESLIYDGVGADPDKKVWRAIGYYWSVSGTSSLRRFLMIDPKYQITNYTTPEAEELYSDNVRVEETDYALSNGLFQPMGLATAMSVRCVK